MYIIETLLNSNDAIVAVLGILAFLLAIILAFVLHEMGHAYAAKWNGDLTAQAAGRLSFNPIVHIDPIGFIMLLFVGFGYAKPVPVNPYNFKHPKKGLLTVSLAGVIVNFALAVLSMFFYVLIVFIIDMNAEILSSDAGYYVFFFFHLFFRLMITINISLMLFNLLPLGPLDGLKVLEALTRRGNKIVTFLRNYGVYILYGLIGLTIIVSYTVEYAEIMRYFDLIGMYISYGVNFIGGGITSLFMLMFGIEPIWIGGLFFWY